MATPSRVGGLRGQFAVDNDGAAAYTIPLALPPGTGGVEPSLTLSYSSAGGNDLLGVGWQLGGLSMITRVGQTPAQDGAHTSVNYSGHDRYALDGQRLVPVQGDSYEYAEAYHTEIETWQQVTPTLPTTDNEQGPDAFHVIDRRGFVSQYGGTTDAKVRAGGGDPSVRVWALNRVHDRNGNYMTITYNNANGSYSPQRIDYTGHGSQAPQRSVQFTYEARPDPITHYVGGHPIVVSQRLTTIDAYVGGAKVLSYQLAYEQGAATGRSRLVSVTMIDADGVSVTPTTFGWQEGATTPLASPSTTTATPSQSGGDFVPFDVDGSGHMSFVNAYSTGSDQHLALQLYLNDGTGKLSGPVAVPSANPALPYGGQLLAMDVNGDGCTDLVYGAVTNGRLGLTVFTATSDGQGHSNLVPGPSGTAASGITLAPNGTLYAADVNGDGLVDLIYATPLNNGQGSSFTVLLSTGGGFGPPGTALETSLPYGGVCLPLDFDGDGRTDLVYAYWISSSSNPSQKVLALAVLLSYGNYLTLRFTNAAPSGLNLPYPGTPIPLDLNGDGLTDIVYATKAADGKSLSLTPLMNTTLGFLVLPAQTFTSIPYGAVLAPAEVNGDDRTDLVAAVNTVANNQQVTQLHVLLGNGSGFTEATVPPALAGGWNQSAMLALDVLGTGMTGVVFPIEVQGLLTLLSVAPTGHYPDLLTGITEGLGGQYTVTYKPMTDGSVYTHTTNSVKPQGMLAGGQQGATYVSSDLTSGSTAAVAPRRTESLPMWLVSGYAKIDGRGGSYQYTYRYQDAAVDLVGGRGWQGFAWQQCRDADAGTFSTTMYQQAFPYTWQVRSHAVGRSSDGAIMQITQLTQTATQPYPNVGVYDVNVTQNVTGSFTFNHIDATRTVTTQFDGFGNPTLISDLGDGSGPPLYTQHTYHNDTGLSSWLIGQTLSTIQSADSAGQQILSSEKSDYDPQTGNVLHHSVWHDQTGTWLEAAYTYDVYGNRLRETDPAGAVRQFTYDATYHTFLASIQEPATASGQTFTTMYEYEPVFGRVTQTTDANGVTRQRQYDTLGQLRTELRPNPQGTLVPVLMRTIVQDQTGTYLASRAAVDWGDQHWAAQRDYVDGFARVYRTLVTSAGGSSWVTTDQVRNSRGQVLEESLPYYPTGTPVWVVHQYDAYGRLSQLTRPADGGATTTTTYQYPNVFTTVETAAASTALARTTTTVNGSFKDRFLPVTITDATGATVQIQYDPLGRMTRSTDAAGNQMALAYDTLGQITLCRTQNGGVTVRSERHTYQPVQRTASTTDARGRTVTQTRDALGRLILKTDDAGHRTTFAYDTAPHYGLTRLGSTTFPDGTVYTFDYDALGNEAALTAAVDGGTYTFQRTFFPFGRANHVTYPDGTVATVRPTPGGLVDSVKITQGGQTLASVGLGAYTALGKPLIIVHGNGVTETLSYNGPGQLHSHAVAATSGTAPSGTAPSATTLGSRVFAWTPLDDLSTITDQLNPANSYGFRYDAAGRLTSATGPYPSPQSFAYDHGGNLTGKSGMSMTYQNGLLKSAGSTTFQSDAAANVAAIADPTGGATTLTWDADGRLTKMVDTSFTYDYVGRRLSKTTPGGPRTYYIAPDYEVTVLPNGQRQHTKYLRSPLGLAAAITTVDQAGTGGATSYPGVPGPGVYCFHRDHLNSPWIVTDGSGTVAARVAYLPFGEVASLTGSDVFRAKFGGRELDAETGLSDFSARYYSTTLGRFVSPDDQLGGPVGEHDVFNPFAYAGNNPATRVDPTGHNWFYHAVHGTEHFFSHPVHTVTSAVTHEFHKVTSGATSDWNRVKHSAPKWLPYVVDGLLIVAGVAVLATTPFGGPFSAMIGSALLGAGVSGLTYNLTHRDHHFSWRNWGIQLGIGAAVGFVTGGLTFGAGALADGLASAGYESFVAGAAGRLVLLGFSGVVVGGGSAAFQRFLNNEADHEPPAEGVGWAAVVGGVAGGLGSAAGELAASSDALTEEQSLEDFQSQPEEKQQGSRWYPGRRVGTSMWTKLLIKVPGTAFSAGGKAYLDYGPRWSYWDYHFSKGWRQWCASGSDDSST